MKDFLRDWGSLLLAVIALVQPWLLGFWLRFFRRSQVDIYEIGSVEVGFSSFGPTIGLHGTLRSLYRDAFIRSIDLKLTRSKDQSQHAFRWGIFRTSAIGPEQQPSYQLCSPFLLTKDSAFAYNIQFWDAQTQEEGRSVTEALREAWASTFMDAGGRQLLERGADLAALGEELREATAQVYSEFANEPIHVNSYQALQRLCYWEAGRYSLEMTVTTVRPKRGFSRRWEFELTAKEVDLLRLNIVKLVQDACGQQRGSYNFAYPRYEEGTLR